MVFLAFLRGCTNPTKASYAAGLLCLFKCLKTFSTKEPQGCSLIPSESSLEAAIELLLFGKMQCIPQMHLTVDPGKQWGAGKNGYVDIFVGNSQRRHNASNSVLVMELGNVSLLSLWKARQQRPDIEPTSQNDFEPLLVELRQITEDQLLDLQYSYFDYQSRQWVTQRVRDILQVAIIQVNNYMSIISCGHGGPEHCGVFDDRVLCRDEGQDLLRGYVIICVGGRQTETVATQHSYEPVLSVPLHEA
jgi:hypothetical protein